jgi:ribosomal protein S19
MGKMPHNRGVSMNPVDHPHGGGEGKTSGGRHPVTPGASPRAASRPQQQAHRQVDRDAEAKKRIEHGTLTSKRSVRRRPPGNKVNAMNEKNEKKVCGRGRGARPSCLSSSAHAGVHNGKKFIPVYITENMVGTSWASFRHAV